MMSDQEIEKIAKRVSEYLFEFMFRNEVTIQGETVGYNNDMEEQNLLTELAQALTELDYNLAKEDYRACETIKTKIKDIENKLNKFK